MKPTRRDMLFKSYLGLGSLALADLLVASESPNPLAPKPPHHPVKAKSCIFLFMEGGVSQMDTFEYKPALVKYAGKQMPKADRTEGELATFSAAPNRIIPHIGASSSMDDRADGYPISCRNSLRASTTSHLSTA